MFDLLESLTKASLAIVIETPLTIATDIVTLGGAITGEEEPYTVQAIKKVAENVSNTTDPN